MKNLLLLFLFLTAISIADLKSQERSAILLKGRVELSPAFSFSSIKDKGSESQWYLTVPVRFTYFASKNVGIGSEIIFTESKGDNNTGIAANLLFEGDFPTSQGAVPYVLGGYGLSNSNMILDRLALRYSEDGPTLSVISLGGGIKIPIISHVFGKIEIRYQNYSGKETYKDYLNETFTNKIRTNYVNAIFGISILI
jgi:hypothetical protein